jgi:hypothetical protein
MSPLNYKKIVNVPPNDETTLSKIKKKKNTKTSRKNLKLKKKKIKKKNPKGGKFNFFFLKKKILCIRKNYKITKF